MKTNINSDVQQNTDLVSQDHANLTQKKAWHSITFIKLDFQKTEGGSIGGVSDVSVFHS